MLARVATSLVVVSMVLSSQVFAQGRGRSGGGGSPSGGGNRGGSMGGGNRSGGSFGGGNLNRGNTGGSWNRNNSGNSRSTWQGGSNQNRQRTQPDQTSPNYSDRTFQNRSRSTNNSWTPNTSNSRTRADQSVDRTVTRRGQVYSQDRIQQQQGAPVSRSRTVYQNRTRGRDNGGRTVVVTRERHYQAYSHHNRTYYRYRPVHYYQPHFYSYCYAPLYTPWSYTWGWYAYPAYHPWYGYYGYYYRPWATYAYPSYWMTDYIIAEMLQDRYDELQAEQASLDQQRADLAEERREIDEATKKQIATQVEKELKARQNQESVSLEDKLSDPNSIFAVSETIEAAALEGGACKLSQGDLIKAKSFDKNDDFAVMSVVTSQAGSCKAGSTIYVSLDQLQEFDNDFSARVDDAVEELGSDPELSRKLSVKPETSDEPEDDYDDMYPPTKKKKKKN